MKIMMRGSPLKAQKPDFQSSVILIVDDTPNNLGVAVDALSQLGATVIVARSGQGGLKRAKYVQPDLILLDILMPEMDGFEVCRQLKGDDKTRTIPVIFMTALTGTEDKVKGLQSGGIDYVTKPFQIEELLARIANHLNTQKMIQRIQAQNQKLQQLVAAPIPSPLQASPQSKLQQAIDYIHAHLEQNITVEEIATALGMSQFYFCRWFKKSMGIAPYQYVIQQRVEQAKTLLHQQDLSLTEVALQCGLNSQSHLIHHFKKQVGMTPKRYRAF